MRRRASRALAMSRSSVMRAGRYADSLERACKFLLRYAIFLRMRERGHSWDDTDARLLDILQIDADQTLRELGDQVGLSPSAVQRRLTRYKTRELLRTVSVLDTTQASVVQALVVLTLVEESAEHHRNLANRLRARPEVQQCYALSGRWDYAVIMAAPTLQALHGLGNELFKD